MSDHASDAVSLVESLSGARVLCVGDIMLDRFVTGSVERISPEAPIPVLHVTGEEAMLGGAGNVVRNLGSLGAKATFVSALGPDAPGDEIDRLLVDQDGVEPTLLRVDGRQTAIKTRFVAGTQQMLRADRETVGPLPEASRADLVAAARAKLDDCAVLILSDYGKGVLDAGVAGELIAAAREAGRPVIVDPKGTDYARYEGASLLTPNRKELQEATRMPLGSPEEIEAAARSLIERFSLGGVLATLGADGMMLVPAEGDVTQLAAEAREVFDVSGAGDTVVATLSAALAAGAALPDAAYLANVAAGIVVAKVGTATAYAADLVAALHHQDISDAEAKVLTLEQAQDRIAGWRRQGLSVGFTNGCFDLLHPGHVSILRQARAACDRLVVGLNSDASVSRLKGPERPVQTEASRGTVLASLSTVDTVVIFGEDTPLTLIETLKPDVLVKGADYTVEEVVGADIVQGYGGRVLLAALEDGHSTTATIQRMNNGS